MTHADQYIWWQHFDKVKIREIQSHIMAIHLHLGHLADACIQSDLQ
jgi:hypothetical protein